MQMVRKKPTPIPTVTRRAPLLMWGTVSAKTCRSGSATVTAKPSAKLNMRIIESFLLFVRAVPILLPIGIMEASAPREKNPMPKTTMTVPMRKLSIRSV